MFARSYPVQISDRVRTAKDLTEFIRCALRADAVDNLSLPVAEITGTQSSGALRSMSLADVLVVSPAGVAELRPGERALALDLRAGHLSERNPFAALPDLA